MDNAWTDVAKGESHALVRFASGPSPLSDVGGGALLKGEAAGWATDFLYDADPTKRVALKTPGSKTFYAVDDFIANAGTSPKTVYDSAGVLRWSPHNLALQSAVGRIGFEWGGNGATYTGGQSDPNGGTQALKVVVTPGTGPGAGLNLQQNIAGLIVGQQYVASMWLKGTAGEQIFFNANSYLASSQVLVTFTGSWQRVSSTFVAITPDAYFACECDDRGAGPNLPAITFYAWGGQFQRGNAPTTYVATTTAARVGLALDYDPVTHAPRGLWSEPQATNLVPQSQTFDNVAWSPSNVTVVANQAIAPDGTMTMDKVYPASSGSNRWISQPVTTTAVVYTYSVYAKAAGKRWLYFIRFDGANFGAWFDLQNGVVGNLDASFTSSSIQSVGNGIYRCSVTGMGQVSLNTAIGLTDANGSGSVTVNATDGVYLWGAQLEPGTVATSYIPTLGATVTRAMDVYNFTAASINHSATAGSWWMEHYLTEAAVGDKRLIDYGNTAIAIHCNSSGYEMQDSGSLFYILGNTVGAINKVMNAFATGDRALTFNGFAPVADAGLTAGFFNPVTISIGARPGFPGDMPNNYTRKIRYLPRRPSNAEMQTMTALTGGKALLKAEANGMATDFIYAADAERVAVKTAGAVKELGLDAFYQNTGGSPKQVFTIDGKLGWSPHNLELWSEDFTDAAWVKGDSSVIANAITAPNGTLTADKFVQGAGTASKFLQQLGPRANNGTFSVYAKAGENSKLVLQDYWRGGVGDGFDLIAGTVYPLNIPTLTSTGKAKIELVGNGWYRCSIPVITGGDCCIYIANNSWNMGYTGDGVSGLYVWGAQLNYGPVATPYIVTTSAVRAGLALDYDPITHAPKGLLCEPQATNTIKSSTDMTNAAVWWGDGVSELNAGVAPNGLMEALRFSGDGLGAYESGNFLSGAIPGTITGNVSVYAKAGSTSQFFMMSGSNIAEGFDLATGTVFVPTEHGNPYATSGLGVMRNVGNGWWRCSCPATAVGDFWIGLCRNKEMVSQGAELSMYLWGPQGDGVNSFPTSYIPTYAAGVTRAADDIAVPTTAFPFSLTNLSMAADIVDNIPAITADFFSVCGSDGVLTESIGLYSAGFYVRHTFAYQALISAAGVIRKVAVAAAAADFRAAFDAALALPSTTGVMPTYTGTSVRIGGGVTISGAHGNFYLKKYTIVPRSWTNAELQAMTT